MVNTTKYVVLLGVQSKSAVNFIKRSRVRRVVISSEYEIHTKGKIKGCLIDLFTKCYACGLNFILLKAIGWIQGSV